MRLTVQSDYALRMLMQLAVHNGALLTISAVAERFDISKNHLMKIAQALVANGTVHSTRGRNGGLRLARKPEQIVIGTIVRELEASSYLVECFQPGQGECRIVPACRLAGIMAEAQQAFFKVLDGYTLADLTLGNDPLQLLLSSGEAR